MKYLGFRIIVLKIGRLKHLEPSFKLVSQKIHEKPSGPSQRSTTGGEVLFFTDIQPAFSYPVSILLS